MTGISIRHFRISWLLAAMLLMGGVTVGAGATGGRLFQASGGGVFEWSPDDWEAAGFTSTGEDLYSRDEVTYSVRFSAGTTIFVEMELDGGGGSVTDVEDRYVAELLPMDTRFVDEFSDVLPGTGDHVTVVLFTSDALYGQASSRSGVILVTYVGSSASSIDRVSIAIGTG